MTIRLMLRLVFGFTISAAILLLVISLSLKSNLHISQEAANERFELNNLAELAETNSAHLTRLARQFVTTLNPEYLNQYNKLVNQIQGKAAWSNGRTITYLDRLREAGVASEDLAILAQSTKRSMRLVETEVKAFSMVQPLVGIPVSDLTEFQRADYTGAIDLLFNQQYEATKQTIVEPVTEFIEIIEQKSLQRVVDLRDKVTTLSLASVSLAALIIAALIMCYLRLDSRVIKTLRHLRGEAKRIASGDLSKHIEFSGNDEISHLSQSLNSMSESLAELLQEISINSEHVESSSKTLDQIAQDALCLNDNQNSAIEVISSSVYENSVAVKEVSGNCSGAAESVKNVEYHATKGEAVVRQGIATVQGVARVMSESIASLADLETSVNDVTSILNVISDIAEQTNLLALNAAIEAARAGEQGRGFAVVADEVRTLASRTQTSTVEIRERISALQNVRQTVTDNIYKSDDSVKEAVKSSEKIGETLQTIASLTRGILDMNRSIATASEEQSIVTDDISERLTKIRDTSAESKEQAETLSTSAKLLSGVARELTERVKHFELPTYTK